MLFDLSVTKYIICDALYVSFLMQSDFYGFTM